MAAIQLSHDDFCIDCSCNQYNPDFCCLSCVHYFDNREDESEEPDVIEEKLNKVVV